MKFKNSKLAHAIAFSVVSTSLTLPVSLQVGAQEIEEIVVSARRRDESLADVPDSLKVFGETFLEDAGVGEITDISNLTPNLFISDYQEVGRADINLRGLGSVVVGDSPVAVLVDGVTLPSSLGVVQELFDVKQIEVLRGPQGALYGRNAIGGAINIVTKDPSDQFEGQIKAGIGKGSARTLGGSISGPVVEDKLAYRLSAFYEEADGLFTNALSGEDAGYKDSTAIRGKLLFYPSDSLSIDLRFNLADKEGDSALWHWEDTDAAGNFGAFIPNFSPITLARPLERVQTNTQGFSEFENTEFSVKVDWETSIGTVTYIGSSADQEAFNIQDGDFSAHNSHIFRIADESDSTTHEIRLTSDGDRAVRYVAGLFYQDVDRQRVFAFDASLSCLGLDTVADGFRCVAFDSVAYDPSLIGDTSPFIQLFTADQDLQNEGYGIFGQLNIDLSDRLELTLAARYDDEDRSDTLQGIDLNFSEFQPKVQLSYDLTDATLVYATYSTGFRPGGVNPTDVVQFDTYASETLDNYEIGFKSSFGSTFISGALFSTDVENQQLFLYNAVEATQNIFNARESSILGAELEMNTKLGDSVDLILGLGYLDTEINDFGNEDAAGVLLYNPAAVDGNTLPYNPELSLSASLQHSMNVSDNWTLISRVDLIYNGETYWFFDNVDRQSSYSLTNLRFSLQSENATITLYANNVFDEEYDVSIFPIESTGLPGDFSWKGNPVDIGLQASYRF